MSSVYFSSGLLSLSGFFGMFGTFGRSSKQSCPPVMKLPEVPGLRSLELNGDLIGHSGAVQVQYTCGMEDYSLTSGIDLVFDESF